MAVKQANSELSFNEDRINKPLDIITPVYAEGFPLALRFYYLIKPLIPRAWQILLRQMIIQRKKEKYADTWPIDKDVSGAPAG